MTIGELCREFRENTPEDEARLQRIEPELRRLLDFMAREGSGAVLDIETALTRLNRETHPHLIEALKIVHRGIESVARGCGDLVDFLDQSRDSEEAHHGTDEATDSGDSRSEEAARPE